MNSRTKRLDTLPFTFHGRVAMPQSFSTRTLRATATCTREFRNPPSNDGGRYRNTLQLRRTVRTLRTMVQHLVVGSLLKVRPHPFQNPTKIGPRSNTHSSKTVQEGQPLRAFHKILLNQRLRGHATYCTPTPCGPATPYEECNSCARDKLTSSMAELSHRRHQCERTSDTRKSQARGDAET
jgi:hypothetical protein